MGSPSTKGLSRSRPRSTCVSRSISMTAISTAVIAEPAVSQLSLRTSMSVSHSLLYVGRAENSLDAGVWLMMPSSRHADAHLAHACRCDHGEGQACVHRTGDRGGDRCDR